jgi:hypothetical protein
MPGVISQGNGRSVLHSDQVKRVEGPRLGDYTGLPINDAARLRADSWDAKVSLVTDPACLEEPLIRSATYAYTPEQQLPGAGGHQLTADELPGLTDGAVPLHLPGTNDQLREFADSLGVPVEVTRGGRASLYPEYQLQVAEARSRAQSR